MALQKLAAKTRKGVKAPGSQDAPAVVGQSVLRVDGREKITAVIAKSINFRYTICTCSPSDMPKGLGRGYFL